VQAVNVVADVRGTDPSLAPVCVMMPRSGWHANASERGGGLVAGWRRCGQWSRQKVRLKPDTTETRPR
jgi:hypothetical protein